MTAPRGTPLQLRVARLADDPAEDSEFVATLVLDPLPVVWPELPAPPLEGDPAPALPPGLRRLGSVELPDVVGRPHLLFFWATWCKPCKAAVPEVMAFAAERKIPVIAISDETAETVADFLRERQADFFDRVVVDPLRRSYVTYGVSGTPTLVLVDGDGVVRHRQVGYKPGDGLSFEGWSWP
jgi:thiol-disulfide isomerase/thioredoxin